MAAKVLLLVCLCGLAAAEIQLAHVIYRHGQRTPADTYPKDPYVDFSFEPVGWGQLTNQGKLDQFNQGKFLRERYNDLLGDIYSPSVIIVQSTDVDRTKMSAQLELAGLWPPAPSQKWNPNLDWQPIPIHSQPLSQDSLLLVRVPCRRYYEQLEKVLASEEVKHKLADYEKDDLYAKLTNLTGMPISNPEDVQSLYSTLKAEEGYNLTLPDWTHDYYPDKLEGLTAYSFLLNAYNTELQKLKGGPLLKKILAESKAKAAGTLKPKGRKMFMYAGHDSTITNLLMTLKVWDPQVPDYGILTMIELHKDTETNEYGLEVYLRNSTSHAPFPLTIPGCEHHRCPLDKFTELTKDVMPDELGKACVPEDPAYVVGTTPAP